jgi:hypothetical protein
MKKKIINIYKLYKLIILFRRKKKKNSNRRWFSRLPFSQKGVAMWYSSLLLKIEYVVASQNWKSGTGSLSPWNSFEPTRLSWKKLNFLADQTHNQHQHSTKCSSFHSSRHGELCLFLPLGLKEFLLRMHLVGFWIQRDESLHHYMIVSKKQPPPLANWVGLMKVVVKVWRETFWVLQLSLIVIFSTLLVLVNNGMNTSSSNEHQNQHQKPWQGNYLYCELMVS